MVRNTADCALRLLSISYIAEGFNPTTPAPAVKKGPPKGVPRQTTRSVAGPSKAASGATTTKKGSKTDSGTGENGTVGSLDVAVLSSDDDGRKLARKDVVAKGKGKEPTANTAKTVPQANGKSKAKGKAKADSVPPPENMDVDGAQPPESVVHPERPPRTNRVNVRPVVASRSPPPAKRQKPDPALEAEVTRLRRKLEDVLILPYHCNQCILKESLVL